MNQCSPLKPYLGGYRKALVGGSLADTSLCFVTANTPPATARVAVEAASFFQKLNAII